MIVELLYRWRVEEQFRHLRHPRVIYVVDLTRCPLKRNFEFKFPELVKRDLMSPSSIIGTLTHLGFEWFLEYYAVREGYKVFTELELARVVDVEGKEYVISGRLDALLFTENSSYPLVVELKTSRSDVSIPYEHHVLQVQIYAWMVGAFDGILVYFTPDRVVEFSLSMLNKLDFSIRDVKRLVKETLLMSPSPRYVWECKYCKFANICPNKVISQ